MKSYEILPTGMTGSAKEPKPDEILPGAGTAAQGLVGWTKGASLIARGVPMYGASGNQGIGLPYDPEGMMPAYGGLAESSIGKMYDVLPTGMTRSAMGGGAKVPKSYEILPGADTTAQGCGGKNDECGCGGSCGGEKSASVMMPHW